ncbi:MAG: homoserine dehydrogenase [Cyanobium sp. NAT70]|nr:homoserine dehydrogenase [Cyanobium sp. NAT70]
MGSRIGIGLLGLGTVGGGVASILFSPQERHPLVSDLEVARVAVRDLNRARTIDLPADRLTTDPHEVVRDPAVDVVVEVIGGIEPARTLILEAIAAGKSVVTANKAVIARHGQEIAEAAASAGVYVLIEAAVGGGIPIIEPLKQSLGGNRIDRVSGIINGTTNYILTRMADEGAAYDDVLAEAQKLGYAEADPAADVDGLDAADKIAILSTLAFGGAVERSDVPTQGISQLQGRDVDYARQLGYGVKLLAVAERMANEVQTSRSLPLSLRVQPTLVPTDHPLFGVNGVNNAILVEGEPIGRVMFYGPGAGAGPTASAVVADILNIAGIRQASDNPGRLDPLLAAGSWRSCSLVDPGEVRQRHYVRFNTTDTPGVIGSIGSCFGDRAVSIQSIVQFNATAAGAEIVVITHEVSQRQMDDALNAISNLAEVSGLTAHLGCL